MSFVWFAAGWFVTKRMMVPVIVNILAKLINILLVNLNKSKKIYFFEHTT